MVISDSLLNDLTKAAQGSPRLRMNYDLRNSAEDKSQRMLNALEPGTVVPIHRHSKSSETVVVLRGRVRQNYYDADGNLTDSWIMESSSLCVGCQIPIGQWHNTESLETGTVIFESKDGPWEPQADSDIMNK